MKYLVLFTVAGLVLWAMRRNAPGAGPSGPSQSTPSKPRHPQQEAMLRCAHCGLHLPTSDALVLQGRAYCCAEHAQASTRDARPSA